MHAHPALLPADDHAALLVREFAAAPVEGGAGVVPISIGRGRSSFEVTLTGGPGDPFRLAVGVDIALGVSVHRGTPELSAGPTLDLRIDQVAEPVGRSGRLLLEGEYRGHTGSAGVGAVVVRDDTGRILAQAVGTMVVEAPVADRARRLTRIADIAPFDPDQVADQVLRAADAGAVVQLPLTPSLTNLRGSVHGGVVLALGRCAQDRLPGPLTRTLSTTVEYLRPLAADGAVACRTEPVRLGRRFRTLRSELLLADGRTAAVVTTTREIVE